MSNMYITVTAKQYLEQIRTRLGESSFEAAADYILEKLECAYKDLSLLPKGPDRAKAARGMVKKVMELELSMSIKQPITCAKGCSECCRMFVCTVESEAEAIYRYVKSNNIKVNWERAETQRHLSEDDFFTEKMGENNKCMFLSDEGTCKVYNVRPLACRLHFVVSPKENCSMFQPDKVLKGFLPSSEAILMALLNLEKDSRCSLPDLMLMQRDKDA